MSTLSSEAPAEDIMMNNIRRHLSRGKERRRIVEEEDGGHHSIRLQRPIKRSNSTESLSSVSSMDEGLWDEDDDDDDDILESIEQKAPESHDTEPQSTPTVSTFLTVMVEKWLSELRLQSAERNLPENAQKVIEDFFDCAFFIYNAGNATSLLDYSGNGSENIRTAFASAIDNMSKSSFRADLTKSILGSEYSSKLSHERPTGKLRDTVPSEEPEFHFTPEEIVSRTLSMASTAVSESSAHEYGLFRSATLSRSIFRNQRRANPNRLRTTAAANLSNTPSEAINVSEHTNSNAVEIQKLDKMNQRPVEEALALLFSSEKPDWPWEAVPFAADLKPTLIGGNGISKSEPEDGVFSSEYDSSAGKSNGAMKTPSILCSEGSGAIAKSEEMYTPGVQVVDYLSELHQATAKGDIKDVVKLLSEGADMFALSQSITEEAITAIECAVKYDQKDTFRVFLANNINSYPIGIWASRKYGNHEFRDFINTYHKQVISGFDSIRDEYGEPMKNFNRTERLVISNLEKPSRFSSEETEKLSEKDQLESMILHQQISEVETITSSLHTKENEVGKQPITNMTIFQMILVIVSLSCIPPNVLRTISSLEENRIADISDTLAALWEDDSCNLVRDTPYPPSVCTKYDASCNVYKSSSDKSTSTDSVQSGHELMHNPADHSEESPAEASGQTSTNDTSDNNTSGSSNTSENTRRQQKHRPSKKQSSGNGGGDEESDDRGKRPVPRKPRTTAIIITEKLPCPYGIAYPHKHDICARKGQNFPKLTRVKEHIWRKHKIHVPRARPADTWEGVFRFCFPEWTKAIPSPYGVSNLYNPSTWFLIPRPITPDVGLGMSVEDNSILTDLPAIPIMVDEDSNQTEIAPVPNNPNLMMPNQPQAYDTPSITVTLPMATHTIGTTGPLSTPNQHILYQRPFGGSYQSLEQQASPQQSLYWLNPAKANTTEFSLPDNALGATSSTYEHLHDPEASTINHPVNLDNQMQLSYNGNISSQAGAAHSTFKSGFLPSQGGTPITSPTDSATYALSAYSQTSGASMYPNFGQITAQTDFYTSVHNESLSSQGSGNISEQLSSTRFQPGNIPNYASTTSIVTPKLLPNFQQSSNGTGEPKVQPPLNKNLETNLPSSYVYSGMNPFSNPMTLDDLSPTIGRSRSGSSTWVPGCNSSSPDTLSNDRASHSTSPNGEADSMKSQSKKYMIRVARKPLPQNSKFETASHKKFYFDNMEEFREKFDYFMLSNFTEPAFHWDFGAWEFQNNRNFRTQNKFAFEDELEFMLEDSTSGRVKFLLVPKL